jgi:hypothetical protein
MLRSLSIVTDAFRSGDPMTPDAQILAPTAVPGESTDPRRWLTLVILLLAAFMNLLDGTNPPVNTM